MNREYAIAIAVKSRAIAARRESKGLLESIVRLEVRAPGLSIKLLSYPYLLGYPLKVKMADNLIQCSIFSVKHDGTFDFLINQVFFVNN